MAAAGVPTAGSRTCTTAAEVAAALDEFGAPYVVKDDALAAGKGVVVTADRAEALAHAAACDRVVIEEFLDGPEVSLFAVCDGTTAYAAPARPGLQADLRRRPRPQHRRHGRLLAAAVGARRPRRRRCSPRVVQPTARRDGPPRRAVRRLPVRRPRADRARPAGDRVQRPLRRPRDPAGAGRCSTRRSASCSRPPPPGSLAERRRRRASPTGAAVTVVLASAGYPESSSKGDVITGVETADGARRRRRDPRRHRRRRRRPTWSPPAAGCSPSRATGTDVADARAKAYAAREQISFDGLQRRTDIAAEPLGVVEGASLEET